MAGRGGVGAVALGAAGLSGLLAACASLGSVAPACERDCLIGLTETYLAAMVADDPAAAPVAETVKFTENTTAMPLGNGLAWDTTTAVRDYKIYVTDPENGQVALYTTVDGEERAGLLTLRIKVEDRLIAEVESVYVGIGLRGFGSVDGLVEAAPVWSEIVPSDRRRPRDEMIAITDRYFETLEESYLDYIPFTDDCLRIENGIITAGRRDGGTGIGSQGCRDNLNNPIWAYITHVDPRRYLVVDEEHGLVSGMFMFRHTGTETSYVDAAGETVPFSEAMLAKQSVVIAELFKIDDGRIARIEAVMVGGLDLAADDGWDD
jgi:hypothetical protein